jgi:transcriptional regulator with XRE-family HTH domain
MNANRQLKENLDALLRTHHLTRKDLAQWCHKTESWISKIFKEERREFSIKALDRIADMFGLVPYQLFLPGVAAITERRRGERRNPRERRQGHAQRQMIGLASNIDAHRSPGKGRLHVAAASPLVEELRRLTEEHERKVSALISRAESRGQTAGTRPSESKARKGRRNAGGSDAPPPAER